MPYMPSSDVKNRDHFYNYVPTGQHSDNGYDPFREQDLAVATFMMKVVENHFPGHFWVAESDAAHNRCHIKLPMLMGNWGYQFRVTDLMEADGPKYVMRGAGELLERFKLKMRYADEGALKADVQKAPVINGPTAKVPE